MKSKATEPQNGTESNDELRAKWENFAFTVCRNGYVNVCNKSHNDDKNHTHSVEVVDGSAVGCSCPHATYRDAHCKHQIAVENSPIVLSSASAASSTRRVASDGGEELPKITHHVEPEHVGGERYARCEGCESESIFGAHRILHDNDCAHAGNEPRDYSHVKESDRFEQPDMGGGESTGVVDLE